MREPTPLSVAVEPSGKFAYVANYSSNNISAYSIDATSGALTPLAGSPLEAGTEPYANRDRSNGQVRLCRQP